MADEPRDIPAEVAAIILSEVPEFRIGLRAAAIVLSQRCPTLTEAEIDEGVRFASTIVGQELLLECARAEGGVQ